MKKRKRKKSLFSKLTSKGVILTIQLITSIVFLIYIFNLKVIPVKYYIILIILIIILFLAETIWITSGLRKKRRTGSIRRVFFSKVTSLVMSILLITGSIYASIGDNFINNITNAFMQTRVIAVYALKTSNIEQVSDLNDKVIGIENKKSISYITEALAEIQDQINKEPEKEVYKDYVQLADALYKGDVDCIIADQSMKF